MEILMLLAIPAVFALAAGYVRLTQSGGQRTHLECGCTVGAHGIGVWQCKAHWDRDYHLRNPNAVDMGSGS